MSEEIKGYSMRDSPSARSENASALMVCDFEPGISIPPDSRDGFTLNFLLPVMIIPSWLLLKKFLSSHYRCNYKIFKMLPSTRVNI